MAWLTDRHVGNAMPWNKDTWCWNAVLHEWVFVSYLCNLLVLLEGLAGLLGEPPVAQHAQVPHTGRGQTGRHNLFEDLCKYSECRTLRRQCRVCNIEWIFVLYTYCWWSLLPSCTWWPPGHRRSSQPRPRQPWCPLGCLTGERMCPRYVQGQLVQMKGCGDGWLLVTGWGSADLPRVLNVSVGQSERSRGSQGPMRARPATDIHNQPSRVELTLCCCVFRVPIIVWANQSRGEGAKWSGLIRGSGHSVSCPDRTDKMI